MEFAKWRAWRGLRGHVLACSINWACVGTWRALKNGVPGVLHKMACLTCLVCLKLMKCFVDVLDQGTRVNVASAELSNLY